MPAFQSSRFVFDLSVPNANMRVIRNSVAAIASVVPPWLCTRRGALFCAGTLTIGCFFEPVNEGAVVADPEKAWLTAVGQVFSLYRPHQNNQSLAIDMDGCEQVSAAASLDQDGGEVVITLANRDPGNAAAVELSVLGADGLSLKEGIAFSAESWRPASTYEQADAAAEVKNSAVQVEVPKHGVVRLTLGIA